MKEEERLAVIRGSGKGDDWERQRKESLLKHTT